MLINKDVKLEQTIDKIINILKRNMFDIKIRFTHFHHLYYSCRVLLRKYPLIGTNGKGTTKLMAKASGLAEFMERLQSFKLIKPSFCIYKSGLFERLKRLDFKTLYHTLCSVFDLKFTSAQIKLFPYYNKCTDYLDYFNNKRILLPYIFINGLCNTNGYCAGNNFYEAISQGICEIFERYCLKESLFSKKPIPNININDIVNTDIKKQFSSLKKLNFKIIIKDLSRGKFPVLGILLISKDNKYLFASGSDVDINIAIQKCLTEIFQGLNDKNYKNKMKNFVVKIKIEKFDNFYKMFINNSGELPLSFVNGSQRSIKELYFKKCNTSKESFIYLISILKRNKDNLYIKDCSLLGFDTYHVFIPTLSYIYSPKDVARKMQNKDVLKNYFYHLYSLTNKELGKFLNFLEGKQFNRCGEFFNSDIMFVDRINDLNSSGLVELIKNKQANSRQCPYYQYFKHIKTPNANNCSRCPLRKKCYINQWNNYANLLLKRYVEFTPRV